MIERIHNFLPNVKDYYTVSDKGEVFSDNLSGRPLKKKNDERRLLSRSSLLFGWFL